MVCREQLGLRDLLAHGCYTHLISVKVRIEEALGGPAGLTRHSIHSPFDSRCARVVDHAAAYIHFVEVPFSARVLDPPCFPSSQV